MTGPLRCIGEWDYEGHLPRGEEVVVRTHVLNFTTDTCVATGRVTVGRRVPTDVGRVGV